MLVNDTIAAVATPPGTGGVAIIRISGSKAHDVLKKVFSKKSGYTHGQMYFGSIKSKGVLLDEGLAVLFFAPRSYTGEDTAELHCHGGAVGVRNVLQYVYECGARPAQPGEFTRRAFLNGKMDLTQAEAVADYISAVSEAGAKMSMKQLEGKLKTIVTGFQERLTDLLAEVNAAVEYPEEDLETEIADSSLPVLERLLMEIRNLSVTFDQGRVLRHGLDVAIIGKPNAGKSSLLNRLVQADKAIVADVPGTTRDVVEQSFYIDGILINLKDTAGIRRTNDTIENEGVKRSKNAANDSKLVIFLLDEQAGIDGEDQRAFESIEKNGDDVIVALNKIDLSERRSESIEIPAIFGNDVLRLSAKTGEGIESLKKRIYAYALADHAADEDMLITNERHRYLLDAAAGHIDEALAELKGGMDMDCVTIDLNAAWSALGEVTGNTVSEDIIDRIFEKFCLGK
ncbi:MAG: tRNA uridine-5-carboxymethylaminomethyl(34) synthesis GTPase MnmE [Christensenellaceae bacterium]|jgi:tRNA modification GTPase